jgi:hypothetical protein
MVVSISRRHACDQARFVNHASGTPRMADMCTIERLDVRYMTGQSHLLEVY